ncbi:MAG: hypothetical protein ABSF95_23215 [Verrucomicrobiota bacterium]|jgi:hypothetical protein
MKKNLIVIAALACLLLGCEVCPHYNRIRVGTLTGGPVVALPKKEYGTVKLYQDKSEVTEKYEVIALMSLQGDPGDEPRFIKAFLYRAADLGADGVILYRGQTRGVSGWYGITGVAAAYRAEAIRYLK